MILQFLKVYFLPIVLAGATTAMAVTEISSYLRKAPDRRNRGRLTRRMLGLAAMLATSITIAIGIYFIKIRTYNIVIWAAAGTFLLVTLAIAVWDMNAEMRQIKRELNDMCREDLADLEKALKKKNIRLDGSLKKNFNDAEAGKSKQ